MGRAPRKIEYIKKERTRNSTFIKRKQGLLKKAWEFSTLCGIDVCMIIYGPRNGDQSSNQFYVWPEDHANVTRIINRFQEISLDERGRRAQDLSDYFTDRQKRVEHEISKQRKKNVEMKYAVSDDFIKGLSEDGLWDLITKVDGKIAMVILKLGNHHSTLQQGMPEPFDVQNLNPCQDFFPIGNMDLGMFKQEQTISPYKNFDMQYPMSYYQFGQSSQSMLPSDQNNQMAMMMMPNNGDNLSHFVGGSSSTSINNTMQYNSIKNPVQRDPTFSYLDIIPFNNQMIASNGHNGPTTQETLSANGLCPEEIELLWGTN